MTNIEKLRHKVNGRVVGILSHGKSIQKLEREIYRLRDYDICWVSFNNYMLFEKHILYRIEKKLDIVLDCAFPANKEYELNFRIPNFKLMLQQKTMIISSLKLLKDKYVDLKINNFYDNYQDNFLYIENFKIEFLQYLLDTTIAYLIGILISAHPKKIILFGFDGLMASSEEAKESYYQKEAQNARRALLGKVSTLIGNRLIDNTTQFNNNFNQFLEECYKLYNIKESINIINCSPNSYITSIPQITYKQLYEEL